jgi:hypothetical protein
MVSGPAAGEVVQGGTGPAESGLPALRRVRPVQRLRSDQLPIELTRLWETDCVDDGTAVP